MNETDWTSIEKDMNPHPADDTMKDYHSASGFKWVEEDLQELIDSDRETVVRYNLTHQDIAAPLFEAKRIASEHLRKFAFRETTEEFCLLDWNDDQYKITYKVSMGRQYSPFQDGTYSSMDITVMRKSDNKQLTFSGLLPEMIARYGFYEGRQVPYRLDPEAIIEFFHLAPDLSQHHRDTQG